MRKTILLTTVAIATIASMGAMAADLSVRRPVPAPAPMVPVAPPVTWTGCYIGGNIGAAFGHGSVETPFGSASADNTGFAGGGQVGCDYQFAGGWVIGFRNMFDGTTNHHSRTFSGAGPFDSDVVDFNNRWFDTLTGRLGYSWVPNWLLYGQGGAAWANTNRTITTPAGVEIGDTSKTRTGWTVGGGVEWMFLPHWSAFLEGNYMDFGSDSRTVFTPVGTTCSSGCGVTAKATEATVLVGVNYRFW
jgi:outer membrane immunogenic protein